jgi:hypothetical protein
VNINMLHNQTQMAEAEYAFLTGLTGFGEIQTQSGSSSRKRDSDDVVNRIETPWWQFQSFQIYVL